MLHSHESLWITDVAAAFLMHCWVFPQGQAEVTFTGTDIRWAELEMNCASCDMFSYLMLCPLCMLNVKGNKNEINNILNTHFIHYSYHLACFTVCYIQMTLWPRILFVFRHHLHTFSFIAWAKLMYLIPVCVCVCTCVCVQEICL